MSLFPTISVVGEAVFMEVRGGAMNDPPELAGKTPEATVSHEKKPGRESERRRACFSPQRSQEKFVVLTGDRGEGPSSYQPEEERQREGRSWRAHRHSERRQRQLDSPGCRAAGRQCFGGGFSYCPGARLRLRMRK